MLHNLAVWTVFASLGAFLHQSAPTLAKELDCDCGKSNTKLKQRIVGGSDSQPNEFPWMVAIFQPNQMIYCGGSIISDRHILTAGHCVFYTKPYALYVVLGMHDRIAQDGSRYNVSNVLLHPEFEPLADYDVVDVAAIVLDRRIVFTDTVRPICLPASVRQIYDGRRAMVAGWGRMSEGGANSQRLQTTRVMMMSGPQCAQTQLNYLLQQDKMMCGYARRADACQGDSGGPLVVNTGYNRFEQIGVISFGSGCGTPDVPGIYVPVTYVLPWLHKLIDQEGLCREPQKIQLTKETEKPSDNLFNFNQ